MASFPRVRLGSFLKHRKEFFTLDDSARYKRVRVQLHNKGIVLRDVVEGAELKTKLQQAARPGELLVAEIDAKVGGFGIVPLELHGAIVSSHYFLFEVDETQCLTGWLDAFIRSGGLEQQVKAQGSTNYAAIRPEHVLDFEIPLAAASEQRRIVARIEELAARIDKVRDLRTTANIEGGALFRAALDGFVASLPPGRGTLGEVLREPPRNGWSVRCDGTDGGTPVLTLSAVTGFRYRPSAIKRTSEPVNPTGHYWLEPGDLLITRSNTPQFVGHAAVYDGRPSPCIYPDLMMRCRVQEDKADISFVHLWLQSSVVREHIRQRAKGTSPTMKKIAQGDVEQIPFPVLDLEAQRAMVGALVRTRDKLDAVVSLQEQTSAELEGLIPSILGRAFKGEL